MFGLRLEEPRLWSVANPLENSANFLFRGSSFFSRTVVTNLDRCLFHFRIEHVLVTLKTYLRLLLLGYL